MTGQGDLLTTREAAELLGVSPTSIKRWSDDGKIPVQKTAGGHRRYRRADLQGVLGAPAPPSMDLARRLPEMERAEIDALPVGVIKLADDGRVLLYNQTEARFSGIPVRQAEGQHFFNELAPCTNNRIVHGQFQQGRERNELDVVIDYTFTYRMRPTNVRLHLYRDPASRTNWITVSPRG